VTASNPWTWAVVMAVLVGIGGLFGALGRLTRRWRLPGEAVRKAAHIGVGLMATSFAWVFADTWPVIVICGSGLTLMLLIRHWPRLHAALGATLHDIDRASWGDLCVPIVIPILHGMAMPNRLTYVIPILILTLGDAAAALIGQRFGTHRYSTDEGFKTIEGSCGLGVITFAIVSLVLLGHGVGWERALAVSMMLALLITLAEAVAWRGLDNMIVPLGSFALLHIYLDMPMQELAQRVGISWLILIACLLIQRRAPLIGSGGLASALLLFGCWSLGGWMWLLPPLAFLLLLPVFGAVAPGERIIEQGAGAVFSLSAAALLWLFTHATYAYPGCDKAFIAACAAAMGTTTVIRARYDGKRDVRDRWLIHKACLLIVLLCAMHVLTADPHRMIVLSIAGTILAGVGAAMLTFLSPLERNDTGDDVRWLARSGLIVFMSLAGFLAYGLR
jgi:phytol kinase